MVKYFLLYTKHIFGILTKLLLSPFIYISDIYVFIYFFSNRTFSSTTLRELRQRLVVDKDDNGKLRFERGDTW